MYLRDNGLGATAMEIVDSVRHQPSTPGAPVPATGAGAGTLEKLVVIGGLVAAGVLIYRHLKKNKETPTP